MILFWRASKQKPLPNSRINSWRWLISASSKLCSSTVSCAFSPRNSKVKGWRICNAAEYYYPDLVFYNRILHCGVIIELKNEEFSHENLGQLNAYVSYYKENEMQPGDNPPVGILLCTRKGKKMVEYALAGMDNQLFVSTYMLQLPDRRTLEDFLLKQLGKWITFLKLSPIYTTDGHKRFQKERHA